MKIEIKDKQKIVGITYDNIRILDVTTSTFKNEEITHILIHREPDATYLHLHIDGNLIYLTVNGNRIGTTLPDKENFRTPEAFLKWIHRNMHLFFPKTTFSHNT